MNEQVAIDIARNALTVTIQIAGPLLLATLGVGMLVSIFQSVTQINEATLTFVPKMVVVAILLAVMGPWMSQTFIAYAVSIFTFLPQVAR